MGGPAAENSLVGLRESMLKADGIEFDLRMTLDGHIVLHHDRTPMIPKHEKEGRPKYVESWTLDELRAFGVETFEEMLADPIISTAWREQAKVGVIEIKRPHPRFHGRAGWWDNRRDIAHMGELSRKIGAMLDEAAIPAENTVLYAFHPRMANIVDWSEWKRPWSRLTPNLPPFGNSTVQRSIASVSFLASSFARLVRTHKKVGSPMMPCALDYLVGLRRHIPIGRHVGLTGKGRKHLTAVRKGYPVYVWPAPYALETALIDTGLSSVSDSVGDPTPRHVDGRLRWKRMATAPLDGPMPHVASDDEAEGLLKELDASVAPWHELDTAEHRRHLEAWRKRWGWSRSVDDLLGDVREGGATMPWEAVRMVGHRGTGKTPRPVLHRVTPQT